MTARPLRKILVVDDQHGIRSLLGLTLGKIGGFTLRSCASGEEALREAREFAPDLLLLDLNMPGLDGVQTLEGLRAQGIATPVVFFTVSASPQDVARYAALGALGTIPKPFDPLKLGKQVLAIWEAA